MNKLRKILYIIAFVITFAVFQSVGSYDVHAEDLNVVIALTPDGEIGVGDTITATVMISGDYVANYTIYLKYSSGLLEYQSGDGNTGSIAISGSGPTTVSYTFKAVGEGRASVSTDGSEVYDAEGNQLTVAHAGANITIGTVQETDNTIKVGSETYTLVNEYHLPTPPKDYVISYVTLGEREWFCYQAPNQNLKVVCLQNVDGEQKWFVFDEKTQSFSPFLEYKLDGINYVVINKPDDVKLPDGFTETSLTLDKTQFTAYTDGSENGVFLVYAMNPRGESGLYYFDSEEGTLTRYEIVKNMIDTATAQNAARIASESNAANDSANTETTEKQYAAPLFGDDKSETDEEEGLVSRETLKRLLSMMIVLFVVMCIVVIILVVRTSILQNRLDGYEDDDEEDGNYDEDEYDYSSSSDQSQSTQSEQEAHDAEIAERAKRDAADKKVIGKNKSYGVNEDTGEILLEEAEDNNAGVNVPPAEDQQISKVEEAMKQKPFGIDSAFSVAAPDEAPEGEHVYVEQGPKKDVVDKETIEKVRGEKNEELAEAEAEQEVEEPTEPMEEIDEPTEQMEIPETAEEAAEEKVVEEQSSEESEENDEDVDSEDDEEPFSPIEKAKNLWLKFTNFINPADVEDDEVEDEAEAVDSEEGDDAEEASEEPEDKKAAEKTEASEKASEEKTEKSSKKSKKSEKKSDKDKKVVLPKTDEEEE
ncbi:MAG: hypothetical protein J5517_01325 [Eubacterium sp.]|nr:hypothetical protein [Eubacterium sp.]